MTALASNPPPTEGRPMSRGEFLRRIRKDGWTARITGGGHLKLEHPSAAGPVFAARTPRSPRSWVNSMADMRRALRHAASSRGADR